MGKFRVLKRRYIESQLKDPSELNHEAYSYITQCHSAYSISADVEQRCGYGEGGAAIFVGMELPSRSLDALFYLSTPHLERYGDQRQIGVYSSKFE
ncbi:hypothetical protein GCM10007932_37650 [Vibrio penaeicida]|uniref:Uncharacterized protein n=1 Tax=Vibrio penaeicida TaxID=104609 RepID=A0AAV5NVW6_9VIBR|nr:hypothetical protein GCM10007932_37650 [Vibrio penaeicida]